MDYRSSGVSNASFTLNSSRSVFDSLDGLPLGDGERGLIVTPPTEVSSGGGLRMEQSWIDEQVLRFAVLFWDKLVWADSNFMSFGTRGGALFLADEGILLRPTVNTAFSGGGGDIFVAQQIAAYKELEAMNPGRWAIHQGENALVVAGEQNLGRGMLVSLFNTIPVSTSDVALEDVLAFKLRRGAELDQLRSVLDEFYIRVSSAEDTIFCVRTK